MVWAFVQFGYLCPILDRLKNPDGTFASWPFPSGEVRFGRAVPDCSSAKLPLSLASSKSDCS
jgi:hypothetical protein